MQYNIFHLSVPSDILFSNDENNVKISEEKWGVNIENYWKDIYQKHTNNVNTYWNEEEKLTYLTSHTYGTQTFSNISAKI